MRLAGFQIIIYGIDGDGGGGEGRGTRRKSILLNILLKKVVRCHGITL